MRPQAYIENLLTAVPHMERLDHAEDDLILSKILSKKFRKYAADETATAKCREAISLARRNHAPIKLGLLFGGNKLWRLEESPEVDWAELFSLLYYIQWMKTIASVYENGVHLEYYSQDNSAALLNNLPMQNVNAYTLSFRQMIQTIEQYLPPRVTLGYICHSEKFDRLEEYQAELAAAEQTLLLQHNQQLPEMDAAQLKASELNVKPLPNQVIDLQARRQIELQHQAIFMTKSMQPYLTDPSIIPIGPTPFPGSLAVGSSKRTLAKFWVCVGALQMSGDNYATTLLTPTQLNQMKNNWQNINIPVLNGKNFSRIRTLGI